MANEQPNRIGVGIDLDGGQTTLETIRDIRREMQIVKTLAADIKAPNYSPRRQQAIREQEELNAAQGRLFADGIARQGVLFGQEEMRKTRIVETESVKRRGIRKSQLTEEEKDAMASQRRIDKLRQENNYRQQTARNEQGSLVGPKLESERKANIQAESDAVNQRIIAERRFTEQANLRKQQELDAINTVKVAEQTKRTADEAYYTAAFNRRKAQEEAQYKSRVAHEKEIQAQIALDVKNPSRVVLTDEARRLQVQKEADSQNKGIREQKQREADEKYYIESFNRRKLAEQQEAASRLTHEREISKQIADDKVKNTQRSSKAQAAADDAELARLREINKASSGLSGSTSKRALDTSTDRAKRLADSKRLADEAQFEAEFGPGRERIDKGRDKLLGFQNTLGKGNQTPAAKELQAEFRALQIRAVALREELAKPTSIKTTRDKITGELKEVENEFKRAEEKYRRFREVISGAGNTPGGPPGPPPGGGGRPAFNEKGFFTSADVIGRISRNILLYQVVSQSTYGLANYITTAIQAARTADDFRRALVFASEASKTNTEDNFTLAESLRTIGASRQEGRAAVTEGARFIEGLDTDPTKLVNLAANIAASRGEGIDKTDELIEQLRRGESKFFKRQFGKTVEELYREEGTRRAIPDNKVSIENSKSGIKTDKEAVDAFVASLTEAQKEKIRYDFILSQGARFEGEAAKRSTELAGRLDTLVNRFQDGKEGIGEFITEITVLGTVVEKLSVFFDKAGVSAARLKRSGAGNTISNDDIQEFANLKTNTARASALTAVNEFLVPAVGGLAAIGGLGLLGRRKATTNTKNQTYDRELAKGLIDFDGDSVQAVSRAKLLAGEAKPGLIRSVTTGMNRITNGITQSITDFTGIPLTRSGTQRNTELNRQRSANFGLSFESKDFGRGNFATFDLNKGRPGNRQYFEDKFNRIESDRIERLDKGQRNGGIGGGLIGGAVGFEVGSLIASAINAGPITTAGITVLGGIAGGAAGTALGSAAGGAIATSAVAAGGYGALFGGLSVAAGAIAAPLAGFALYATKQNELAERNLKREEVISFAYGQQQTERNKARTEGRERFTSNKEGDFGKLFTAGEVQESIASGERTKENFLTITSGFDESGKKLVDRYGNVVRLMAANSVIISQAEADILKTREGFLGRQATAKEQEELSRTPEGRIKLVGIQNGTLGTSVGQASIDLQTKGREYDLEREKERTQREDSERQGRINDQARALSKLRETAEGSFKIVDEVATGLSNDNLFAKVFSDGATALARMDAQFGFLNGKIKLGGQNVSDFFAGIEDGKNKIITLGLQYDSLTKKQDFSNKAARETLERGAPGLTRRETQGNTIAQSIVDAIKVQGESRQRQGQILGFGGEDDPVRFAKQQISQLNIRAGLGGFGAGGSSREIDEITQAAIEEALSGLSIGQIGNDSYLKDAALRNTRGRSERAESRISDEIAKRRLIDEEDAIVAANLREGRDLFNRQGGGKEAQEALDRFNIARTDNIAPKDLTFNQFQLRQESLKRSAEAEGRKEAEAKANVEKGLAYQAAIVGILGDLRKGILGGDASIVIKVLNDTLARLDQEALQDNNPGFKVPLLDTNRKTNPYTALSDRYGRGGRRQ